MALRLSLKRPLLAAGILAGSALSALAAEGPHVAPMTDFAGAAVKPLISDPMLVSAIKAQNEKHAGLSQADIDAMDQTWRAETAASERPTIETVLATPLSERLRVWQAEQNGMVTEVFVMDNKGLNVGQSDITSDYWQGDEDKFTKTYGAGPDALFIDEVEMDESTQTFQSQLSMPVVDPDSGSVIGAITVGINVDAL